MEPVRRRTLQEWRQERGWTLEQLQKAGVRLSQRTILQWEQTGEPPNEARGLGIDIARALGIPLDQLDLGAYRRPFTEAGYQVVLFARGRDDRGWESSIESWKPPATWSSAVAERANTGMRTQGATKGAVLDELETELRQLIRTNPPDSGKGKA
jgi:transcriptional regulator with XRE-family HTH domain